MIPRLGSLVQSSDVSEAFNPANTLNIAYVFSRDIKRVLRVAKALQAGIVGVNSGLALFPNTPFGGHKMSGMGKELGKYALDDFTNLKTIYIR